MEAILFNLKKNYHGCRGLLNTRSMGQNQFSMAGRALKFEIDIL